MIKQMWDKTCIFSWLLYLYIPNFQQFPLHFHLYIPSRSRHFFWDCALLWRKQPLSIKACLYTKWAWLSVTCCFIQNRIVILTYGGTARPVRLCVQVLNILHPNVIAGSRRSLPIDKVRRSRLKVVNSYDLIKTTGIVSSSPEWTRAHVRRTDYFATVINKSLKATPISGTGRPTTVVVPKKKKIFFSLRTISFKPFKHSTMIKEMCKSSSMRVGE